jgi:hypothetical protein
VLGSTSIYTRTQRGIHNDNHNVKKKKKRRRRNALEKEAMNQVTDCMGCTSMLHPSKELNITNEESLEVLEMENINEP